jgi:hypothetical protein
MPRTEYYREYRRRNREQLAENQRRYYARHAARVQNANKAWRERNAEKAYAHEVVNTALKRGKMFPEPCLFCDGTEVDAHHHDYSLPLMVTWLCREHHKLIHMEG